MSRLAILLLVFWLAAPAQAGPDDEWIVQFKASDSQNGHARIATRFGTGLTTQRAAYEDAVPDEYAMLYCDDSAPPGVRWRTDIRVPMAAGTSRTWRLTLTAGALYPFGQIKLTSWNLAMAAHDLNGSIPVKLVVVSDPSWPAPGSYTSGAVLWTFDPALNGDEFSPPYTVLLNWTGTALRLDLIAGESGQPPVECTIGEARTSHIGQTLSLRGTVVTSTPADNSGLWVQAQDGSSAIRVQASWGVSRGDRLDVTGVVAWQDGVPVLTSPTMGSQTQGVAMRPRFATQHALASDLTETLSYQGINPVGLLVAAFGQVTAVDTPANVFYIDDGSHLQDGTGPSEDQHVGLRVAYKPGTTPPIAGSYVRVTGIRTVSKLVLPSQAYVNGTLHGAGTTIYVPVLAARDAGDVRVVN